MQCWQQCCGSDRHSPEHLTGQQAHHCNKQISHTSAYLLFPVPQSHRSRAEARKRHGSLLTFWRFTNRIIIIIIIVCIICNSLIYKHLRKRKTNFTVTASVPTRNEGLFQQHCRNSSWKSFLMLSTALTYRSQQKSRRDDSHMYSSSMLFTQHS